MKTTSESPSELIRLITKKLQEILDLVRRLSSSSDENVRWDNIMGDPPLDFPEGVESFPAPGVTTWGDLVDRKFIRLFELIAELEGLLLELDRKQDDLKAWKNPHKIILLKMRIFLLPLVRKLQSVRAFFFTDNPEEAEDYHTTPFTSLMYRRADLDEDESLAEHIDFVFQKQIRDAIRQCEIVMKRLPQ